MGLVALMGTISALGLMVLGMVLHPQHRVALVVTYIVVYLATLLAVFIWMPSKSLLSLIEVNVLTGACLLPVLFVLSVNDNEKHDRGTRWGLALILGLVVIAGLGIAQTTLSVKPVYRSLVVRTRETAPLLSKKETPIAIAPQTVRNKMNKAMSTVPNTSYYRLGDLQTQVAKGHAVYIAPVEFDGFWRWQRARSTPGYFMIDATNVNAEPRFIKRTMTYTPSAYFNDDAQRVIYNRFPEWIQEGAPQLEVNDQGEPFYIQTVYRARGISRRIDYHSLHVVVLNSRTGATRLYTTQAAPKFINESIAASTAAEMNQVFGRYGHGFFNAHFNQTDVKIPNNNGTESGVTPVVDKRGDIYYFNDFTSPKTDADSTMGYSMINARTGELTYYTGKNIGVMDSDGAKKMADKEYVAQKWRATMPIMYNVDGTPTWVVSLLDSTGAFRSYAYIKAADQSVKAYAATATDALEQYRVQLATAGSTAGATGNARLSTVTGVVDRVAIVPNGNAQRVLFALKGRATLWTVGTDDYPKAVLLKPGDRVKLTASVNQQAQTGTVQTYRNLTFK